jgi:hypothetical protein
MIKIEKNNNTVRGLDTFSIHGDVKDISCGYSFEYEGSKYIVESVAMVKNGNNRVGINDIEVVANKIDG